MHITLKNSQYGIDKKFYVKFVEGFSGLFCIKITWHYGNLKVKCSFWWYPLKYIQNKWRMKKPSLKLKVFLTKRQRLKLLEIHKIIKKHWIPHLFPGPPSIPKKAISHLCAISGGNILKDKAQETFIFSISGRVLVMLERKIFTTWKPRSISDLH